MICDLEEDLFHSAQASGNNNLRAKSSLLPVFVNVLLEHSHVYFFLNYMWQVVHYKSRVEL